MPELPEVETVRRSLAPHVVGRRVVSQAVLSPHVWQGPPVVGRQVEALERKGKYLVFRLDGGRALVAHLRMTGRLVLDAVVDRHTHAVLGFTGGVRLAFRDVRKFGRLVSVEEAELAALLPAGDDARDAPPDAAKLGTLFAGRRGPVKALLLRQELMAGLGNIYADEALWRAGVDPRRVAGGLGPHELEGLSRALRSVVGDAIAHQGTTFRDFRDGRGEPGGFARFLEVYRRAGAPCRRCGTAIARTRVGGRGTHWCPGCQV